MGYSGLSSPWDSDMASELAHAAILAQVKVLAKGLQLRENEFNTSGPTNVGLYFEAFIDCVESSAQKRDNRRKWLAACHELEGQIAELKAAIKKEPQFNRQVELNTHIKKLEKRLRQDASRL